MSHAHRMHLKGPWQYRLLENQADGSTAVAIEGRVKLPAAWQECFADYRGRVRFERPFHCPTNLEPHEDVFVIFSGIGGEATVQLNDTPLGTSTGGAVPVEYEIKALLLPRNLLVVDVEFHGGMETPGGLWGPVALEVRSC